jgi:conjugative transfer signal peptidase TraF
MRTPILLLLVLLGFIFLNFTHIIYLNIFTHSLPCGIYIRIDGTPKTGDFAASCLTQEIAEYGISRQYLARGSCDTGTVPVLKIIKGVPGDHFFVQNKFLELNGGSYRIMDKDSSSRLLRVFYSQKEGIIDKGKYILLSDFVKNSWDSRYWGPVGIEFLLKPLWIFENVKR